MGSTFFARYQAEIVPQFWLLTRKAQSRIFQHLAVPRHPQEGPDGPERDYEIQGTFKPRDYCVQYRETDFNFASRLMEEEGIYYFFKHADGSHKMVVANTPRAIPMCRRRRPSFTKRSKGDCDKEDRIHSWEKSQEIRSGKYTLWDHCFELPPEPRGRQTRARLGAGGNGHPHAQGRAATTSWSSTTSPATTPSASTASTRAAATGPATCRRSSRTTSARSRSACSRRPPCAWRSRDEHLPAVHRRAQVHARTALQRRRGIRADPRRPFRHHGRYVHDRLRDVADLREHVHVHSHRAAVRPRGDTSPPDRGHADRGGRRPPARRSSPTSTAG